MFYYFSSCFFFIYLFIFDYVIILFSFIHFFFVLYSVLINLKGILVNRIFVRNYWEYISPCVNGGFLLYNEAVYDVINNVYITIWVHHICDYIFQGHFLPNLEKYFAAGAIKIRLIIHTQNSTTKTQEI